MAESYDHDLILNYVEGEASPQDRAALEARMAQDAALRRLVEGLLRDRASLRALPGEAPPEGLVEDAMQHSERTMLLGDPADVHHPAEPAEHRRFRLGRTLAYSGLAALLLISGGLVGSAIFAPSLLEELKRQGGIEQYYLTPGGPGGAAGPGPLALQSEPSREAAPKRGDRAARQPQARSLAQGDAAATGQGPRRAEAAPPSPEVEEQALAMRPMAADSAAGRAAAEQDLAIVPSPRALRSRRDPAAVNLDELFTDFRTDRRASDARQVPLPRPTRGFFTSPETGHPWMPPATAVTVQTQDPEQARRAILAFAAENNLPVIAAGSGPDGAAARRLSAEDAAASPRGESSRVVVTMSLDQMPALLARLNREGQQVARLTRLNAASPETATPSASAAAPYGMMQGPPTGDAAQALRSGASGAAQQERRAVEGDPEARLGRLRDRLDLGESAASTSRQRMSLGADGDAHESTPPQPLETAAAAQEDPWRQGGRQEGRQQSGGATLPRLPRSMESWIAKPARGWGFEPQPLPILITHTPRETPEAPEAPETPQTEEAVSSDPQASQASDPLVVPEPPANDAPSSVEEAPTSR